MMTMMGVGAEWDPCSALPSLPGPLEPKLCHMVNKPHSKPMPQHVVELVNVLVQDEARQRQLKAEQVTTTSNTTHEML